MRKILRSRWLLLGLVGLWIPGLAWGQPLAVPGPGPVPPAPDLPVLVAPGTETLEPPPPRGYAIDIQKAKRDAVSGIGVAPGALQTDEGPGAMYGVPSPEPSAPALRTNFNGISFTGSYPPDPVLAAGPSNLVLVTNGSVTIRDKSGGLIASSSLAAFFASVRATSENAFDPKVVYDTGSGRFFLLAVGRISNSSCTPGTCVSHFFLGVSKNSAPTTVGSGDWFFYAFDATLDGSTATANWADYPDLGLDGSVVILTANMFSFSTSNFQRSKIRILNKSTLLVGGAVTWSDFVGMTDPVTGFQSFTLRAALTFGSPGPFFLVSSSSTLHSCDMVVWGIANALTSPSLSALKATAGGTCDVPPDALQSGGGTPIDTGDTRLLNAVYRNGSLWTAQNILMTFGSGNVSAVRWAQINVSGWPASVAFTQDATFGADGIWYFYPAVMVDPANNLGMVFARSGATEFASAYYTGRLSSAPANSLQPSALLKAGAANYSLVDSLGRNRWGDYLGISLDPADASLWMLGEYAVAATAWGTWVGNFTLISTPVLSFGLNQTGLHTGQTLLVTASVAPGPTPVTADVYVAVQLPGGSLLFLQGDGTFTAAIQPIVRSWTVSSFSGQIFAYTFGGGEPVGSYAMLGAFTNPGTLSFIGPIVSAPFTFSP